MRSILILILFIPLSTFSQTKTITGTVLSEHLERIYGAAICINDTVKIGYTDTEGNFTVHVPDSTSALRILFLGSENDIIQLSPNCNHVEFITMNFVNYHYVSNAKIDRLRKKRFDALTDLFKLAFDKGFFSEPAACYTRSFVPIKPELDSIGRIIDIMRIDIKKRFRALKVGDTISIPLSSTYGYSDKTGQTVLSVWDAFTNGTEFECILKGIVIAKDRRKSGYNLSYKIIDCSRCALKSPFYEGRAVIEGAVLKYNMKYYKTL